MPNTGFEKGRSYLTGYGQSDSSSSVEAVIWTVESGMVRLVDVLQSRGVRTTGWLPLVAQGVSADGKTIVGYGINPSGKLEAWIARLPVSLPSVSNWGIGALVTLLTLTGLRHGIYRHPVWKKQARKH